MSAPVAIVTGASSGIGAAVARALRRRGYEVYALARRVERMAELEGAGVHVVGGDVTVDDDLVALVRRVLSEQGRIDALVNNAGYGAYGALEEVPIAEAREQFEVNVLGLARLTQLVLPTMRAQRAGRVVNISSMGGRVAFPLGAWYHATKFALEGLSDAARVELAPFGVRVVLIEPGLIKTEWGVIAATHLTQNSADGPYARQAAAVGRTLASSSLGVRASSPEVVSRAVLRALRARSPRARYVVGAGARPILLARHLLPDRLFDRILRATIS